MAVINYNYQLVKLLNYALLQLINTIVSEGNIKLIALCPVTGCQYSCP